MNENDIDQSLLELLARYFYYIDPNEENTAFLEANKDEQDLCYFVAYRYIKENKTQDLIDALKDQKDEDYIKAMKDYVYGGGKYGYRQKKRPQGFKSRRTQRYIYTVQINKAEFDYLKELVEASGLERGHYIRKEILNSEPIVKRKMPDFEQSLFKEIQHQLLSPMYGANSIRE